MYRDKRRGAAVVETAVCLPLIVLIVFGTIETCSAIFLQQALQSTAYEATRVAAAPFGTLMTGQQAGEEVITQREIQDGAVTLSEAAMSGFGDAKLVTAIATAPVDSNRVLPAWVITLPQLSAQCTMVKEVSP